MIQLIQDQHRARRHLVVCGVDIELVSVSDRGAVTLHQYQPTVISPDWYKLDIVKSEL